MEYFNHFRIRGRPSYPASHARQSQLAGFPMRLTFSLAQTPSQLLQAAYTRSITVYLQFLCHTSVICTLNNILSTSFPRPSRSQDRLILPCLAPFVSKFSARQNLADRCTR